MAELACELKALSWEFLGIAWAIIGCSVVSGIAMYAEGKRQGMAQ